MDWFVSDPHFGHTNVLKPDYDNRPFTTIEEHDEAIITNWNQDVKPTDRVFLLGDVAFRHTKPVEEYTKRLNGQIHLIKGNHDDAKRKPHRGAWWFPELFASVQEVAYIKINKQKIFMSHYAHRVWRASNHGSWHLHGHSHGQLKECQTCHTGEGKVLDVWVGGNNYRPFSFDTIKAYMDSRPLTYHHEEGEEE